MPLTLRRLLKCLLYIALGCYIFLAVAVLGIRYWVLPNLDKWREPIQNGLSTVLPGQVKLGRVEAEWRGRHPSLRLRDAAVHDDHGRLLLNIPAADAVLAWSSLFSGTPRFLSLHAEGVELTLRRDEQNRVNLVGYEVDASDDNNQQAGEDSGVLHWLAQQNHVSFSSANVLWMDDLRGAPPLALRDVALSLGRQGGEYFFSLTASPPESLGASFTLQGKVAASDSQRPLSPEEITGLLYVHVDDMRPAAWQPWMDVHNVLDQGRISWRGWQQVQDGEPRRHVSQVGLSDAVWRPVDGATLQAAQAQLYVAGEWAALQELAVPNGRNGAIEGVRMALQSQGLTLEMPEDFDAPLTFDHFAVAADVGRSAETGLSLAFQPLLVRNADMDLAVEGAWQELGSGDAGLIDLHGRFARAELAAIARYMPATVNDDARNWLRYGLLAGRIVDAPLRLQGDLARFPFGADPAQGDFLLSGQVRDAVIDYAPADVIGPPGWPRLENLNGHAQLHRVDLAIRADSMQMRPGGQTIVLTDVDGRIGNIEKNSILEVSGTGNASADAFLALLRESQLSPMLDHLFDDARGAGQWQVPIALTIPLMDVNASTVQGSVIFQQGSLALDDVYPALSQLDGSLHFTEEGMSAETLSGFVLGGPVTISGGIGQGRKGLIFDGRLTAGGLNEYLNGRLAGLLEGGAAYRLALQRNPAGAYGVQLESSLEGMAVTLPEPLSKAAGRQRSLKASWTPGGKGDSVLDVSMGDGLAAKFLHKDGKQAGPYFFHAGAVNLRGKVEPPAAGGLAVDVQASQLDLDAWRRLADAQGGQGDAADGDIFPPLRDFRLQADKAVLLGSELDHLAFTARQPEGERWRVDISSTQTAGTLFWRERSGRIEGDVDAHFQRLSLGRARGDEKPAVQPDVAEEALSLSDDVEFPAIQLKVDNLSLYGRELGALSMVGLNDAASRLWRMEQLELAAPQAVFRGSGSWRMEGPRRGLTLQAEAMFDDLGAYLAQIGFKDLVSGGHGQAQGMIEWRNLPWDFDVADLQSDLTIDLADGRFVSVGSRSARLLELLSLQSVQRLASLNWNPGGLMQQGFPFDSLQGRIVATDGVLHSENYRVTGPVATIVIAGDVDLPREDLDLRAVVVPNLDVSGAAIAAGIAVNPIVGLGAFLTQWLLKHPMSKAMTMQYKVKGGFDAPDIEVVDTPAQDG